MSLPSSSLWFYSEWGRQNIF